MSWLREADAEPIPGYRLIEPLGSGGFGEVWKCEAPGGLNKAIKFVYGNLNSLDVDCVRAEQEWKSLQRIREVRHPFVCSVERIDNVDGELVIVMELAERTLHELCKECQGAGMTGIAPGDLMRYMRDAAEALDYMNERHNLQHLDIKPRNLFLIGDRLKVADFGLVKHLERQSGSGLLGGVTPLYASPETFTGKISPHSDQYSLAIVYQEMLTGHRPFNAKNIRQMAQMHLQAEPDLRSLPEPERAIVGRALSKDPNKRFANCMSFIASLYKAQSSARAVELTARAASGDSGPGAKTMAHTMEDVLLESFDFGGSDAPRHAKPTSQRIVCEDKEQDVEVSDLGVTVMQPDNGALRPTLIIGVGAFGYKSIMELRCRFLDRFGDLEKLPLLRFLYLDVDSESIQRAFHGSPEVVLTRNEVCHLPLQPVGSYRRRSLDHLGDWLPREKLYAMPRSLQTQGSRALGRLAFSDNQQRLLARLRREIVDISKPDHIYQSVANTGLALCNSTPRVYVIGSAAGGSSGLLPDLGFAIKRTLVSLRQLESRVVTFLACGAPQDPATPKSELSNVYATLTELNHFSDPNVAFTAQYGPDSQRVVDQSAPFNSVYLLPSPDRAPESVDATIAHLGNYLFHELTTPLGLRLDQLRAQEEKEEAYADLGGLSLPLRSFGTYSVWFPRGLLLHDAARHACRRLIDNWVASESVQLPDEVQQEVQRVANQFCRHVDLAPEPLAKRIEATALASGSTGEVGDTPAEIMVGILAKLEEQLHQPIAQDDAGNWAKQSLARVRDWVGTGEEAEVEVNEWRKTRLARLLQSAAQNVSEDWDRKIAQAVHSLMQYPGHRVHASELALTAIQLQLEKTAATLASQPSKAAQAWRQVEDALVDCVAGSGGFRLFGGRSRSRQLRLFMDQLSHYAHVKLAEELAVSAKQCLLNLCQRLNERQRDLGFCKQRLLNLQHNLQFGWKSDDGDLATTRPAADLTLTITPTPDIDQLAQSMRQAATSRVVMPDGQSDLGQAALQFLQSLHSDHWLLLDKVLYERVLLPYGGLDGVCINADLTRQLANPLLVEASKFLADRLPTMDVADILNSEMEIYGGEEHSSALKRQANDYLDLAQPLVPAKGTTSVHSFVLLPASVAGKALSDAIEEQFPDMKLVRMSGNADLMFMQEVGGLAARSIDGLLRDSQAAYQASVSNPVSSPHARFDITDWLPIEP
jgi:hypothetical protein